MSEREIHVEVTKSATEATDSIEEKILPPLKGDRTNSERVDINRTTSNEGDRGESKWNPSWYVLEPNKKLTFDDRMMLIQSTNAGFEQPNYSIKKMSNGNYRITKKKVATPTLSQSVIKGASSTNPNERNLHLSNEQLMFEHVLDLNKRFDELRYKHKKLKDYVKRGGSYGIRGEVDVVRDESRGIREIPPSTSSDINTRSTSIPRNEGVHDETASDIQPHPTSNTSDATRSELPSDIPNPTTSNVSRVGYTQPIRGGWRASLMNR